MIRRTVDIAVSGVALVLAAPLLAVLAVVTRLESPGHPLYRQRRVGKDGAEFDVLKLRTMVAGAEHLGAGLAVTQGDARITRVGALLRKSSLDELPQLVNVLRGDMSLIGPRPPLAREVEQYEEHVHRRFLMKPGITGLWQVSGRSNLSWEDTVRLDLYYVENWSMTGDIVILFKTARAVLARDGAY